MAMRAKIEPGGGMDTPCSRRQSGAKSVICRRFLKSILQEYSPRPRGMPPAYLPPKNFTSSSQNGDVS